MLSTSHAVTGAFIAVKVGNPVFAIPLILLSHYLEDAVPHWDAGTGLTKGVKTPKQAFQHEIVDLLIAGFLVLAFYPAVIHDVQYSLFSVQAFTPIWGAFFGLLPDFLEAPRNFLRSEPSWLKPINKFHGSFHHSIPRALDGLAPQIILLATLWFYR
jgi:hypothetical protein